MKRLIALAFLAGCVGGDPSLGRVIALPPSQMDGETVATFERLPLLADGVNPSICNHLERNRYRMTAADAVVYGKAMRAKGLPKRDTDLVLANKIGTQESFIGLLCMSNAVPPINKAFYPGVGHRWQMVMPAYGYVYLEGDGTPKGMRVTAWN